MDNHTTTKARIRQELDHSVTKWSDINCTSKRLTNSLFPLQKKQKGLNNQTIAYKSVSIMHLHKLKTNLCSQDLGSTISKSNELNPIEMEIS